MTTKKNSNLSLIIAGLLFILNHALLTGIVTPSTGSFQYLIYILLKSLSILGMNLIPLYIGFNANYFKNKNYFKKISSFLLIYLITSIITVLTGFLFFKASTLKYFWSFLFPISQNLYPYAASLIIILLALTPLLKWLDSLTKNNLKLLLYISSFFMVIAPTLYGKNIWGSGIGGLLSFNLYLVILGYSITRLQLLTHKMKFVKFLVAGLLYLGMTCLMFFVSPAIHKSYISAERFAVINSVFAVIVAIYLLDLLAKKLPISNHFISVFLIITTVITSQPIGVLNLNPLLKKISQSNWLVDTLVNFSIYLLIILILSILLSWLSTTNWFNKTNQHLLITSPQDIPNKLNSIRIGLGKNKRVLYVMLSFYILTLVQMESVARASHGSIFELFIHYHPAVFLSMLVLTGFFLLIFFLTSRFWYAYGIIFVIELLLTISTFLKVELRAEPVLPTDMSALKSASDILDMINPAVVVIGLLIVVLLAISTFMLQLKYQKQYQLNLKLKQRVIYIALLLVSLSGLLFVNHAESIPSRVFELFNIQKKFFNQENGARINGPLLQFINNMDVSVMNEPAGYSKKHINEIMKKYDHEADLINKSRDEWAKNQTVIFALSESFSDPKRVPNLQVAGNPIPNIINAKAQNSSGLMMSSGYGGSTANMEWQSLTGLDLSSLSPTLPTPYSQLVTHIDKNPNITNLFDEKIAIHPYNASLYNRKEVFNDFGFQKFYYQGSENKLKYTNHIPASPYVSDESAYKEVERLISTNNNKSQFIQLSTMQNHLPFDKNDTKESMKVSGTAMGKNQSSVENYVQRIRYTDKAVKSFLDNLDKIDRPITLVWYGDHLPGIYAGDSMSKYAVELHQTDYFVFNNKAARNNVKFNKLVSPYSFSALALQQANIKVSPYYALVTQVTNSLPASMNDPHTTVKNTYNGAQVFINAAGQTIQPNQLSKKQKITLDDYKLIQYDIVAGKQYSAKWAMQKAK